MVNRGPDLKTVYLYSISKHPKTTAQPAQGSLGPGIAAACDPRHTCGPCSGVSACYKQWVIDLRPPSHQPIKTEA